MISNFMEIVKWLPWVIIIVASFILFSRSCDENTADDGVRKDSITVAKQDIKRIQVRETALVAKIHRDSVASARRDSARVRQVEKLERRLWAINRSKATPSALDSIRRVLFPDGTEIDSTYAMPLREARECLQAAERLPVAIELIDTLKGQVVELKADNAMDWASFQALDSGRVAEIGQQRIVIRNTEAQLRICQGKKNFWRQAWKGIKRVGEVGAAGVVGYLIGKSVD